MQLFVFMSHMNALEEKIITQFLFLLITPKNAFFVIFSAVLFLVIKKISLDEKANSLTNP